MYLDGSHPAKDDPAIVMESNHYCNQVNEDFTQCVLFDGNGKGARLHGVEYIISEKLYGQLPAAERMYWHPHNYEILSGELVMPGLPQAAEKAALDTKINSYGKTWHFWRTGVHGEQPDPLPYGPPHLAWSFNHDGELPAEVASSVLAFGVPPYAGRVQSQLRSDGVAREIARRILQFEPRIHRESLEVLPLHDGERASFNLMRFAVHGFLRANPLETFDVLTELDLETAPEPERDLTVERADEGDASGEPAADERRQRPRRQTAVAAAEKRAELELGARRQPDPRQVPMGPTRDWRDHAASGHEGRALPDRLDGAGRDRAAAGAPALPGLP